MPRRKERLRVVLDTNVVIRHFISHHRQIKLNFNRRVFELWFIKGELQLIVSEEVVREFLTAMSLVLEVKENFLKKWDRYFRKHRAEVVSLGRRFTFSRDPKDNLFLAVAASGKADFLVTNDRDLLEIFEADRRRLKFKLVTPEQFLSYWESSS